MGPLNCQIPRCDGEGRGDGAAGSAQVALVDNTTGSDGVPADECPRSSILCGGNERRGCTNRWGFRAVCSYLSLLSCDTTGRGFGKGNGCTTTDNDRNGFNFVIIGADPPRKQLRAANSCASYLFHPNHRSTAHASARLVGGDGHPLCWPGLAALTPGDDSRREGGFSVTADLRQSGGADLAEQFFPIDERTAERDPAGDKTCDIPGAGPSFAASIFQPVVFVEVSCRKEPTAKPQQARNLPIHAHGGKAPERAAVRSLLETSGRAPTRKTAGRGGQFFNLNNCDPGRTVRQGLRGDPNFRFPPDRGDRPRGGRRASLPTRTFAPTEFLRYSKFPGS